MDLLARPVLPADHRVAYGSDPSQFGDLWIPAHVPGRCPLVIFFHGGWWKSAYDLGYAGYLCAALKAEGIATWSVEYRRVGVTGGGWPTTFQDAAAAVDFVPSLAAKYPLDLARVITAGHSAGGHLAFWIGGRAHLNAPHELFPSPGPLPLQGLLALAGAVDLRLTLALAGEGLFAHDRDEVYALMGGSPASHPDRYRLGNPGDLLPLQAPQVLVQGTEDDQIPPELPSRWLSLAQQRGSLAKARVISNADHFDVVDPQSAAWPAVLTEIKALLRPASHT